MTSISIAEAILEAAQALRRAGVPEARREAASLLAHATSRDRTYLITHADAQLAPTVMEHFRALVERRARGEPLQYITGHTEFFKLDFEVTPDVLIPRPETELLVETALGLLGSLPAAPAPTICDVGTGSGCIIISILHELKNASGVGLDISLAALRVARRNAERHDTASRLRLAHSDCFAALDARRVQFDMIVSNPPYISAAALPDLQREVRDFEPRAALTPGADGLVVIRSLLQSAPEFLPPGGHLLMEIGFDQHEALRDSIDAEVWELLDIHKDLQGIPRTVALRKK